MSRRVHVIDSHTAGEPTRVVTDGGPDLGGGTVEERRNLFARAHDDFRAGVVNEPRGSDVLVGALLVPPLENGSVTGVIFFNNVGCLAMCGHGLIGVIETLAHLGRIEPGVHRVETPAGAVTATLHDDGTVSVANVPSWRAMPQHTVETRHHGKVTGDIAWGGNWFFLVDASTLERPDDRSTICRARVPELMEMALEIKAALHRSDPTGLPPVDHIELSSVSPDESIDSRNFVLCPGNAYDRSPCGTGTSAKLACLAADDALGEDEVWVQQGIAGGHFTARYRWLDRSRGIIIPTITGRAHITGEATLLFDPADPFCWGIV